jgi:hypothetical protein
LNYNSRLRKAPKSDSTQRHANTEREREKKRNTSSTTTTNVEFPETKTKESKQQKKNQTNFFFNSKKSLKNPVNLMKLLNTLKNLEDFTELPKQNQKTN